MKVTFHDLEHPSPPPEQSSFFRPADVMQLLRSLNTSNPFLVELLGENGFRLTIGLAEDCATVQFSSSEGVPPFCVAVGDSGASNEFVEFTAGGTPTPISQRFCLSLAMMEQIVACFVTTGGKWDGVLWEEI